jgi:hypothetical protein
MFFKFFLAISLGLRLSPLDPDGRTDGFIAEERKCRASVSRAAFLSIELY